nr:HigA family addiction module antidote protein [Eubacterium sp.]
YIEYNDKIAFHPGYYLKEIIDESGLTQEDFAKRLGTTPKNLSILVRGEQSLSIDIATKLSRMLGTTIAYWLNLQQAYDEKVAEFLSEKELEKEREVFKLIDYKYFRDNFVMPDLSRKVDEQIKYVREFLSVSSLTILEERNLAVSFRSYTEELSRSNIVNANAMVQIAINRALKAETPKYNKKKFEKAVDFALTQTKNHDGFLTEVKRAFEQAGVVLVVLPNLKNSGINGATKKVDGKVMIMVNDRRHYADTFWFTLFHEIGHVLNGDLGITFKNEAEDDADLYAQRSLIPEDAYMKFKNQNQLFTEDAIRRFANAIDQDPGIVYGRLQIDGKIPYTETYLSSRLRHKYKVVIA